MVFGGPFLLSEILFSCPQRARLQTNETLQHPQAFLTPGWRPRRGSNRIAAKRIEKLGQDRPHARQPAASGSGGYYHRPASAAPIASPSREKLSVLEVGLRRRLTAGRAETELLAWGVDFLFRNAGSRAAKKYPETQIRGR